MDIFTIRQQLRTTRLSDIPLRVTFYARVSTDSDEQLNSLDNQIGYYRDYITRNPAWTFIDGYIDEGLSGMTTRKRDNFQRMVQDAKNDKFDLILTRRSPVLPQHARQHPLYARAAFAGVGVFFQNDNINTFDEDPSCAHHHVRHCAG
ncbi:MAG: recombinase family protein [Butyricicoccus sp.]